MFDAAHDSNFAAALALHAHRRDTALGITWPSARIKGLLWYYNKLREAELKQVIKADITAAYVAGRATEARDAAGRLMAEIEAGVTPERRQEIIAILGKLEALAKETDNG